MTLTQTQLDHYREHGYLVVPQLIAPEELTDLRQRLVELAEGNHDWPNDHFQILDPDRFRNPNGTTIPFGIQRPASRDAVFARIAGHPAVSGAMSQILDGPVQLATDQCVVRHAALCGGCSFYHQDSYYWRLPPRTGCNMWITLDEVGPETGALAVMPRTHADWTLVPHEDYFDDPTSHNARTGKAYQRHRIPAAGIDFSREELLVMHPGDAVFFSNFTWHRAEGNLTGEHKFAYAIAYKLVDEATG